MDLCNKVIISTPDKWIAQDSIDEKKHPFKSLHFQLHDAGTSKLSMPCNLPPLPPPPPKSKLLEPEHMKT